MTAWQLRVEGPPPTPEFVASALHAGWRTWHTSPIQRTEVGGLLPTLIHRAQTAARLHEGDARRQSLANLAEVYHLAQAYLAWNGERELLWLTVDRGMIPRGSRRPAGDRVECVLRRPPATGGGALAGGSGAVHRAELVRPRLQDGGTEAAATLASLHLCAALTKARAGDQGGVVRLATGCRDREPATGRNVNPRHPVSTVLVEVYATMLAWAG